ncbi:MAG: hypothetical protein JNK34_11210 [Tabrizicola sp.]|nr:hypothetical protein [Tabrizicola sp.]
MKPLALILALAACAPAHAGGLVITEDTTEAAPAGHSFKDALPLIILGLAIAAIASGGSDTCNAPDPVQPEDGC